jgi:16S rRNA (guanine966-N2)-methyltransferase
VPAVEGLRPTPNRIRETLFNWLQVWVEGATCLDVSAGTGSLCFEALSRGAKSAVMVEASHIAATRIRENLTMLSCDNAKVIESSALVYLQGQVSAFDIIFLDPPFKSNLVEECFSLIHERGWLKPGGLLYIEAPAKSALPELPANWSVHKSKASGEVGYHLLKLES